MLTDSPYVAKRVQVGIPIWDIFVRGTYVGVLTNLPMEKTPMATVRYSGEERTFSGQTIHVVLNQVGDWLSDIDACVEDSAAIYEMEYYAEVIAPMEAAERLAEYHFERMFHNDPPEAF